MESRTETAPLSPFLQSVRLAARQQREAMEAEMRAQADADERRRNDKDRANVLRGRLLDAVWDR
jgi:hypothetical protein